MHTIGLCAALLLSNACVSQSLAPSRPAQRAETQGENDAARARTLYVANAGSDSGNAIYGYSLEPLTLIYQTTSKLHFPQGIATDATGDLFVANTLGYDVLKFEPPKTDPTLDIDDTGFRPSDVAIDPSGNIWVANFCTRDARCGEGNVREFAGDGRLLETITCANLWRYYFLDVNRQGEVVVAGESSSEGGAAGEIAHESATCVPLPKIRVAVPGGVRFTADGNVSVTDQVYGIVYTYAKPGFSAILHTTDLLGIPNPVADVFEAGDAYVWCVVPGYTGIYQFPYPAGGYPSNSLTGFSFPTGIAIGAAVK